MNYPSPNLTPLALVPCAMPSCGVLLAPCEAVCLVGPGVHACHSCATWYVGAVEAFLVEQEAM